jgi:hypothetical protein
VAHGVDLSGLAFAVGEGRRFPRRPARQCRRRKTKSPACGFGRRRRSSRLANQVSLVADRLAADEDPGLDDRELAGLYAVVVIQATGGEAEPKPSKKYFQQDGHRHWVFTGTLFDKKGQGWPIQLPPAARATTQPRSILCLASCDAHPVRAGILEFVE